MYVICIDSTIYSILKTDWLLSGKKNCINLGKTLLITTIYYRKIFPDFPMKLSMNSFMKATVSDNCTQIMLYIMYWHVLFNRVTNNDRLNVHQNDALSY